MTKVLGVTSARILGHEVDCVGRKEPYDSNDAGHEEQLPVFHGRKKVQELRAEVGSPDAVGISCNRQKWKDRCDPDDLKQGLRKGARKYQTQLRPAVWPRQKKNATNQINVMSKPGQGVVTRSRKKLAHEIPLAVVNYLREKLGCQRTQGNWDCLPRRARHACH